MKDDYDRVVKSFRPSALMESRTRKHVADRGLIGESGFYNSGRPATKLSNPRPLMVRQNDDGNYEGGRIRFDDHGNTHFTLLVVAETEALAEVAAKEVLAGTRKPSRFVYDPSRADLTDSQGGDDGGHEVHEGSSSQEQAEDCD